MNKKGQSIDLNNPIGAIMGLIVFIFVVGALFTALGAISNSITQDQCKPYQEAAQQCQLQHESDLIALNQSTTLLDQCRYDYVELSNSTITRKDFEEVKGYFSQTQNEISTINKKIDGIDRIYNFYTIKNYSIALNIIFAFEILSFLFLKNEFAVAVFNWLRKKKKKKKDEHKLPDLN